jgi:hypothetical protein
MLKALAYVPQPDVSFVYKELKNLDSSFAPFFKLRPVT